MIPGLVDGSLLLYQVSSGTLWVMVRGYEHPEWGVVGEPYRRPDCTRPALAESMKTYLPCMGRRVPVFERNRIIHTLDPQRVLDLLPARLRKGVADLVSHLGAWWYGITGSWAVSCAAPRSDVDILVYYEPGMERALIDLRREGRIRQCKKNSILVKRGSRRDIGTDPDLIDNSVLDSCIDGVPYTLRLLSSWGERGCDTIRVGLGRDRVLLYVEKGGYTVPSRYRSRVVRPGSILRKDANVVLETWRTRYQELPPGLYIVEGYVILEGQTYIITPDHEGKVSVAPA